MAKPNTFDAIVVGSGMSGGWAAKELTGRAQDAGARARGATFVTSSITRQRCRTRWQLPHNNRPTQQDRAAQPIQSTSVSL